MDRSSVRVLLIDDDEDTRELLAEILADHFEVEIAADGEQAIRLFSANRPDVVVTDEGLPGVTGTQLAERMKHVAPEVRIILVSGFSDLESVHCDAVLPKPVDVDRLIASIEAFAPPLGSGMATIGREPT